MEIAIFIVSLITLIISVSTLTIVYRSAFVNSYVAKSTAQTIARFDSDRQEGVARATNASEQPVSPPFRHIPDIPPEAIAPYIGRPPMPKGGFGAKVTKHD